MSDEEKEEWGETELRHQINEVFFGKREDNALFDEVWQACLDSHNNAVRLLRELVGKTIDHYDKLPNAEGEPHEIMGLLPAAQFLMAINGHSASMLDGICAAMVQDTAGENITGAKAPADGDTIKAAISETIANIRRSANEEMLRFITEPAEEE